MNIRAPKPSSVVGSYEPLLELGRGGMGTAYLARSVGAGGFERLVVLKRLHPHLLSRPAAVQRFLDEARLAAHIRHANVIATYSVGKDHESHFLVLDYVEGAALDELIDRAALKGDRIPVPIVLRIALDVLTGLQAAHLAEDATGRSLQLLHRDVSPQNVLVGIDGVGRIADFGIAKSALGSVETDQRYLVGKILYLAPEYLQRKPVGPSLDVYALGVTLWVALAGTDPFPDADEVTLITRIMEQGVPPLSTAAEVAPRLAAIVERACERNPERRYQSAASMIADLEVLARDTGWIASQNDVGTYVQSLVGLDLERRREIVATRLSLPVGDVARTLDGLPALATSNTLGEAIETAAIPLVNPSVAPQRADESDYEIPVTGRGRAWIALASAGLLATAGAATAFLWMRSNASEDPASSQPSAEQTPTASETQPALPPSAAVPAVLPAHSTSDAVDAGTKPVPTTRRPGAPKPSTGPMPTAKTSGPPAPTGDTGISKSNPYRK